MTNQLVRVLSAAAAHGVRLPLGAVCRVYVVGGTCGRGNKSAVRTPHDFSRTLLDSPKYGPGHVLHLMRSGVVHAFVSSSGPHRGKWVLVVSAAYAEEEARWKTLGWVWWAQWSLDGLEQQLTDQGFEIFKPKRGSPKPVHPGDADLEGSTEIDTELLVSLKNTSTAPTVAEAQYEAMRLIYSKHWSMLPAEDQLQLRGGDSVSDDDDDDRQATSAAASCPGTAASAAAAAAVWNGSESPRDPATENEWMSARAPAELELLADDKLAAYVPGLHTDLGDFFNDEHIEAEELLRNGGDIPAGRAIPVDSRPGAILRDLRGGRVLVRAVPAECVEGDPWRGDSSRRMSIVQFPSVSAARSVCSSAHGRFDPHGRALDIVLVETLQKRPADAPVSPGFVVFDSVATDPAEFARSYLPLANEAIDEHSGVLTAVCDTPETIAGNWRPTRIVIGEFPSVEHVRSFFFGPKYTEARQNRKNCARFDSIIVGE
eukprot:m51a1_g3525 hypothetical protein (486) ;mRNA; f:929208-931876